jgi:hypothetical protein
VVTAIVALLLSAVFSVWLSRIDDLRFPSVGTIRTAGVEAYWDEELLNQTTAIPWGTIHPWSSQNATLSLRSTSNVQITLRITTANWTLRNSDNSIVFGPADSTSYMNMMFDYNGSVLNPNEVIKTTFALHLTNSLDFIEFLVEKDVQQFSFEIDIKAIED